LNPDENKILNTLYKKIISLVYGRIKGYGFCKKGVHLYRLRNDILQGFYFQKISGNGFFRVSTYIRPVFWHRQDDGVLLSTLELGKFVKGSCYYDINQKYEEVSNQVSLIIIEKVLPYFEECGSPHAILKNLEKLLKLEKDFTLRGIKQLDFQDLILFCVLKEKNSNISKEYLKRKVECLMKDDRKADWLTRDRKIFNQLLQLANQNKFSEVELRLETFKQDFLKENPFYKKSLKAEKETID